MQQEVTYKTVRMAIKVLQAKEPRFLYKKILTPRQVNRAGQWHETREQRLMTKEQFTRLKLSTRKYWAVQATKWMAEIPRLLFSMCVKKNAAKKELKAWCLKNIPTTGDMILQGRNLEEGRPEAGDRHAGGQDVPGGGCGQERRQQQMMKKWMQGHNQPQTRRGEQEQTKNKNHGRKRPKQQNTGKEQVEPVQNYSSIHMVQSHNYQK